MALPAAKPKPNTRETALPAAKPKTVQNRKADVGPLLWGLLVLAVVWWGASRARACGATVPAALAKAAVASWLSFQVAKLVAMVPALVALSQIGNGRPAVFALMAFAVLVGGTLGGVKLFTQC